jgi:DNA-3-methyladenine glycosylase I
MIGSDDDAHHHSQLGGGGGGKRHFGSGAVEQEDGEDVVSKKDGRCSWALSSEQMAAYHDLEWGVPVRHENQLFERLTLEGAQAGLSWSLILAKREGYRRAFLGFDSAAVACFDDEDQARLMADAGIVRNRLKIGSTLSNARLLESLHQVGESLTEILWSFVAGATVHNVWATLDELPAATTVSAAMSKHLRGLGFRFVGPTTCYATMQAAGLVNDHVTTCPRWRELGGGAGKGRTVRSKP